MRQSGTIALALVLAWLLVVAETASQRSPWAAERDSAGQVDGWAVGAVRCAEPDAPVLRLQAPLRIAAYCAGIVARRCLRGISLLI